jgi:V8-like Glu-specific endopeptidase
MTHRLGSLIPLSPATVISPGPTTFSPAAAPGGTKFLILHFTGATFGPGDRLEVALGYDTDVFDSTSGSDFWSRPVKGNSAAINFVDGGTGTGQALLSEYGRGEGLQNGGQTNTNADLFLIDTPYVDPTFFNSLGVCPSGASASWENVAVLPPGVMRDTARSVGMFVEASEGKLSSCSAALIAPDLILTAAHCVSTGAEIPSGSFTLDYQTDASGNRPSGYNPKFHKLKRLVKTGWLKSTTGPGLQSDSGLDYAIVQIETPPGGLGVPPLTMRSTALTLNEELFVIHHPRGVVKKVSRQPTDPTCKVLSASGGTVTYACDSDNGSSGSPVLDAAGRIVAVNDWAPGACGNQGQAATAILQDFSTAPPPAKDVDVVLVLDRSGSMSLPGFSGATKIEEARAAAALFLDLLRTDKTHRAGLLTFSTTAASGPPEFFSLAPVNEANKTTLIGPPPRNTGIVGGIGTGGNTTIGGGLRAGQTQLPSPSPAANTPVILLMTDGLQNTPPMIAEVEGTGELGATKLCIIGFGSEANLDGPLLTGLAARHGGIYTRAGEGLELKKFFVLAFGNIFQTGISLDPIFVLPEGAREAKPLPMNVCGEERMTVVLSWESPAETLLLSLTTPAGNTIHSKTPGIFVSEGSTWVYFRLELPFNGERDGVWQVNVARLPGRGEFSAPLKEERYFVTTVVDGGPYFHSLAPSRRYYTGDTINPQVVLREPSGMTLDATVTLDVTRPKEGTGNILAKNRFLDSTEIDGDQIDRRARTLIALEQAQNGSPLISTSTKEFKLSDDGEVNGRGTLEPDGVYALPLQDITLFEGNYTFHARAVYGGAVCTGTRETSWSLNVAVGIDPGKTTVTTDSLGTLADGREHVRITLTPRDRYGNHVGPGRLGTFDVHPQSGCKLIGGMNDEGDGSYTQEVACDPGSPTPPGLVVTQPDRPPVVVAPTAPGTELEPPPYGKQKRDGLFWLLLALVILLLLIIIFLLIWINWHS